MPSPQDYQRIGGWLIVPMIYMMLTVLSASLMLVIYSLAIFMPESLQYLATNANAFTFDWFLSVFISLIMLIFTLWLLWIFFQRSRRFPRLFLLWLLISVLLAIKTFAFSPIPDQLALKSLLWPLLAAALLVPYIKRSRRVQETFTQE